MCPLTVPEKHEELAAIDNANRSERSSLLHSGVEVSRESGAQHHAGSGERDPYVEKIFRPRDEQALIVCRDAGLGLDESLHVLNHGIQCQRQGHCTAVHGFHRDVHLRRGSDNCFGTLHGDLQRENYHTQTADCQHCVDKAVDCVDKARRFQQSSVDATQVVLAVWACGTYSALCFTYACGWWVVVFILALTVAYMHASLNINLLAAAV